jgi:very-short-patch-repair endonuclease
LRAAILGALPDLHAGAHSVLELRDAELRRRHGLPAGTRQVRRQADGSEYLDVVIEEWQLHVELDGRLGHDRAKEIWRDMRRDNRSELLGYRHLRYGWADLSDRGCGVAREQAEVMREQGWRGRLLRYPRCPPL